MPNTQDNIRKEKIEELSAKFREIYQIEAKRQGDVRHHDSYDDLTENIKEFDRVLARYVLEYVASAIREERENLEKNIGALRQWLNEDRITDPSKMVTNEEILSWLDPKKQK